MTKHGRVLCCVMQTAYLDFGIFESDSHVCISTFKNQKSCADWYIVAKVLAKQN